MKPIAGFVCTGLAAGIALLCCAPDAMVKGWGIDLLMAFDVQAPVVWILVLNSPNLWHVGVFAVLTTGLLIAVPGRPHLCVHLAMLLGVFLELAQIFVPGREAGFADIVYNIAGASLAFFVFQSFKLISKIRKAFSHHPLSLETQRPQRGF